ncbi:hypothetical protein BKA67DRAFT_78896 [Truncatella angustata]|uniref:Uncharacterized protein n=1 Tax=Truncatella angustata TaxID=152316 RepID=A0A9P8UZF0_9PEZI|nr:uncharacterized protein BKA67DRAFT_78896 [Truncatella angustata]KAH6661225.1 hypothetical protein BKA67DRAFT_78896 [Truncatella angustata]
MLLLYTMMLLVPSSLAAGSHAVTLQLSINSDDFASQPLENTSVALLGHSGRDFSPQRLGGVVKYTPCRRSFRFLRAGSTSSQDFPHGQLPPRRGGCHYVERLPVYAQQRSARVKSWRRCGRHNATCNMAGSH